MSLLPDFGDKPMGITIRPMQAADIDQVIQLLGRWNIAPISPTKDIPNPERTDIVVGNTIVAEVNGCIVGVRSFIQHSPSEAEGASLAVDPAYHKHGIGKTLILAGHKMMREKGIRKVRAETDRPEVVEWLVRNFGHRIVGTTPKRHAFGDNNISHWTILEIEL